VGNALANFWRRGPRGEPVIVVSGLPRSGTSMLMRMLAAGGIELLADDERPADADNPLGYFELERTRRLERETDRSWLRAGRGRAIKVVSPLLCHLPRDNRYRVLLVLRALDEVIASQNRMLERRGAPNPLDDARTHELYAHHLDDVRRLLAQRPEFEWLELRHELAIAEPTRFAQQVRAFLGRGDPAAMAAAVDPALYHNRRKDAGAASV
jgi:hypothetical protein